MSSPRVSGLMEQHTALYSASKSRDNLYKEETQGPLIQHVGFSLSYSTYPRRYLPHTWILTVCFMGLRLEFPKKQTNSLVQ